MIIENSKLNKHFHLVDFSWQTQCLDTQRYPTTIWQDPYPFWAWMNWKNKPLKGNRRKWTQKVNPTPCIHPLLYPSWPDVTRIIDMSLCDVTHNHLCCHITIQCSDDVMFFLAGNPPSCVIELEWRYLARSISASVSTLSISSWILIVTPGTYRDI